MSGRKRIRQSRPDDTSRTPGLSRQRRRREYLRSRLHDGTDYRRGHLDRRAVHGARRRAPPLL